MTGRFVWQLPTCMEHGRLSQVQRALSVLGLLEALTSIATEEDQAANSQPPYRSSCRRRHGCFEKSSSDDDRLSQTSSLGPQCQEGMPEALAWVAWASNDIECRTSNFRLHRHLHSLTTYCKVQGWRRVVRGQTDEVARASESWTRFVYTRVAANACGPYSANHQILLCSRRKKSRRRRNERACRARGAMQP